MFLAVLILCTASGCFDAGVGSYSSHDQCMGVLAVSVSDLLAEPIPGIEISGARCDRIVVERNI